MTLMFRTAGDKNAQFTSNPSPSLAVGLTLALLGCWRFAAEPICDKEDIRIVNSMREIAQPYHANLDKGGQLFAEWAGISDQYVLQLNQGDSDKQVSLMRSLLTTNPSARSSTSSRMPTRCSSRWSTPPTKSGAWIVTHWGHPAGLSPLRRQRSVGRPCRGEQPRCRRPRSRSRWSMRSAARAASSRSRAGSTPIRRRSATPASQQVLAANPKVKLLDQQTANWDRTASFPIVQTWLSKYGDQIKGVWAANDDMALGALEALRAAGLAGKIPVVGVDGIPEAIEAINKGEMIATVSSDAFYQGSIGLAMGYCVVTGQMPTCRRSGRRTSRDFYLKLVVITKDNAAQFLKEPEAASYVGTWECDKLLSRSTGAAPK